VKSYGVCRAQNTSDILHEQPERRIHPLRIARHASDVMSIEEKVQNEMVQE
jgi:hypothetical protein